MFRLTSYLNWLINPAPLPPPRTPAGPVVIWNLIRRCNLTCKHCYSISADHDFPGELTTQEVFAVMEDLRSFRVPALILSGGEPLLRPDIFMISRRARDLGFYVGLSTNGTLIDRELAGTIADVGYDYVGISIDGIGPTHDRFRRKPGAFDLSLRAVELCRQHGLKVGLRFTLTQDNAHELPAILQSLETWGVDKFYLSHLNYAGRGNRNRGDDVYHDTTRRAMELLIATCLKRIRKHRPLEIVTGNNDADGVFLLHWARRHYPERVRDLRTLLSRWGGNSSGVNVANIDNLGNVHPDTFWWHHDLGNVRERRFGDIWLDSSDPVMAGLKARPRQIAGRCGQCRYFDICGGNTRIRALQVHGDTWAEDPGCYLDDAEIGLHEPAPEAAAQP